MVGGESATRLRVSTPLCSVPQQERIADNNVVEKGADMKAWLATNWFRWRHHWYDRAYPPAHPLFGIPANLLVILAILLVAQEIGRALDYLGILDLGGAGVGPYEPYGFEGVP